MQPDTPAPGTTARRFAPERETTEAELDDQRATNRRQTLVIDELSDEGERVEAALPVDVEAPAAARRVVAEFLRGRVSPRQLDTAQLLISELVASSMRHNAVPFDAALVVRVAAEPGTWRFEVEDPGGDAVPPPDPAERAERRGLGLNLVQKLSDCWGVEHAPERGTRAWAYLPQEPPVGREAAPGAGASAELPA